ncbi:MAG TPA: TadE family protein [Candidatus Limnocylindrales bacterium]|nr:TadE family protein [Candidatus Limnocylindrales bacterium]
MVEFAMVSPILIIIMFLLIDFARLVYAYGAVSWAAREAARVVSMQPQATSDCLALHTAEQTAQGFPLSADPNSVAGNTDPNNPGTPGPTTNIPAGTGLIYIWPAVASASPDVNCNGTTRAVSPTVQDVAVQVKYAYRPIMPLISSFVPSFTITTISVVHTEY